MPKYVDHKERRQEITAAAIRILSRGSVSDLTIKSLAAELGGSNTMVTHFFPNRSDLFHAIVDDLVRSYEDELQDLEAGATAAERLAILLRWMMPITESDIWAERGRIALINHRGEHASIEHFFESMELKMRGLLAQHLEPLIAPADLDLAVETLRSTVNGLVLSAVEHPDLWDARAQFRVMAAVLSGLHLDVDLGDAHAAHGAAAVD